MKTEKEKIYKKEWGKALVKRDMIIEELKLRLSKQKRYKQGYEAGKSEQKAKTKEIFEKLTRKGYSQDDEWINKKQLLREIEKC